MFRLLIFDWDGTIIDSAARIISSMQQAAADLEMAAVSDDAVRNIIGLGLPEALQLLFPGIDGQGVEQMRQRYSHYYLEADCTPIRLFDGVEDSLARLRDGGYQLAVATGKSRRGLDRVFSDTGLGPLFEYSRCADETRSKPDPLMLEELLVESGVAADQALMIGDTEFDLEMATNAGMRSLGVSYGAHAVERLRNHNPVRIIDRFSELDDWLLDGC